MDQCYSFFFYYYYFFCCCCCCLPLMCIKSASVAVANLRCILHGQVDVHVAICKDPMTVHYADEGADCCRGIAEFMSDAFKQRWHPQLLGANAAAALNAMPQVDCVPLTWVLEKVGLTHVNFFVLDVEGGELQVLQAIDFSKVTMDVIVIEADGGDPAKEAAIKALLSQHGYTYDGHVVRNDWFSRTSFEKSTPSDSSGGP
jgi:hypothetical protein